MELIFNSMSQYDRTQHVLSGWLIKLEQCFDLEEAKTIKLCQKYIRQTGADILSQLPAATTWADVEASILSQLAEGTMEKEEWNALNP